MRRAQQEWDYPPRRPRHYDVLDAVPEESGWGSPIATKIVSVYWTIFKTVVKVVLGSILGLAMVALVWLMMQILKVS